MNIPLSTLISKPKQISHEVHSRPEASGEMPREEQTSLPKAIPSSSKANNPTNVSYPKNHLIGYLTEILKQLKG